MKCEYIYIYILYIYIYLNTQLGRPKMAQEGHPIWHSPAMAGSVLAGIIDWPFSGRVKK